MSEAKQGAEGESAVDSPDVALAREAAALMAEALSRLDKLRDQLIESKPGALGIWRSTRLMTAEARRLASALLYEVDDQR